LGGSITGLSVADMSHKATRRWRNWAPVEF
jgi:hypothetical protein